MSNALAIDKVFPLSVLGQGTEDILLCTAVTLNARRLIVKLPAPVPPGTAVRIDCEDAFILGEMLGNWREEQELFGAIDLQQSLTGLREWASLLRKPPTEAKQARPTALRKVGHF